MALFKSSTIAAAEAAVAALPEIKPAFVGDFRLGGDDILAASKLLTAEAAPTGMLRPFLPHQAAAYLYAVGSILRWGGALLGDDMGMGKTQVLAALANDHIADGGYAIVIAPPVTKAGWMADLAAAFPTLRFAHLQGRKVYARPDADIYFMTDDALTMRAWLTNGEQTDDKGRKFFTPSTFAAGASILIRDEIHRDKGNGPKPSVRGRVMLALSKALRGQAPIVAATGTVLTNRPIEAYTPLRIIGGDELLVSLTPGGDSPRSFIYRYCAPTERVFNGRKVTLYGNGDSTNMLALHENLRRTVYVRREKSDLGDFLPHSGWIVKPIALNGVLNRYDRIARDFLSMVLEEKGPEAYWRAAAAERLTQMTALYKEAGIAKAAAAGEYIGDLVEEGRHVVAFYVHNEVRDSLTQYCDDHKLTCAEISGAVTGDKRVNVVNDFQAGKIQVLICQIAAAGLGVTLTQAADAVFVQVPWSAGSLKQAADRILRVDDRTQARAAAGERITWHVLQSAYADGAPTFDMAIWQVLEHKAQVCDAVNAGKPVTMSDESVMQAALEAWYPAAQAQYN